MKRLSIDKPLGQISADQLRRAAEIKEQIETLELELAEILESSPGSKGIAIHGRRTMSAAARARIAAAQRARWAKVKGKGTNSTGPKRSL